MAGKSNWEKLLCCVPNEKIIILNGISYVTYEVGLLGSRGNVL